MKFYFTDYYELDKETINKIIDGLKMDAILRLYSKIMLAATLRLI